MPFLSLGLHYDKDAPNSRPEGSLAVNQDNESRSDSKVGQPRSVLFGTEGIHAEKSEQSLSPEIESLREKLSKKSQVKVAIKPLIASVDALSSSERYGVPTFATFKFGYVPARGLLYSSIGHELGLLILFLLFTYGLPALRPQKLHVPENPHDYIVYLPEVGGGSEGQKSPSTSQASPQAASAAPARSSRGFAYPGSQAILSDPPHPTNAFQTVQRPLLVHPEPIRNLVPLPNIVQYRPGHHRDGSPAAQRPGGGSAGQVPAPGRSRNQLAQADLTAARRAEHVHLGIPAYRDITAATLTAPGDPRERQ